MKAPFPWFGGKSRVAAEVWQRFGNVRTYVEPFFGSGAVLLAREFELSRLEGHQYRQKLPKKKGEPQQYRLWAPGDTIETVNDADCYLANFWRAVSFAPELVAGAADWPVNEADLHARHGWLVEQQAFCEQMMNPKLPNYFDPLIAGWWVWGISCWIGSGWCSVGGSARQQGTKRPDLQRNGQGLGVHGRQPRKFTGVPNLPELGKGRGVHKKRPHLADRGGKGVHRQLPRTHSQGGMGVHGHRVALKRPHLTGNAGGSGVHGPVARNNLEPWFLDLQRRLRPVRVVCGDFARVTGRSVVLPDHGHAGIFLDPPYPAQAGRQEEIYSVDCGEVAHRAHAVALEWGANDRVRVAFCGYEGSHAFPDDWECIAWKAAGGYGGGQSGRGEANRHRERIWFSPACLKPSKQLLL